MKKTTSLQESNYRIELSSIPKKIFLLNKILHSISIPDNFWNKLFSLLFLILINFLLFYYFLITETFPKYFFIYLIIILLDSILILSLPKLRISFGNFSEQILVIQFPRFLVSIMSAILENSTEYSFYLFLILQFLGTFFLYSRNDF